MSESAILLELRGISKAFPGVRALEPIDLEIRRGETHILLGENGAGKSTLIKTLTGVYAPDEGQILYKGKPVVFKNPADSQKAGIRVIYQESNLVAHLTVAENIHLGSEPQMTPVLPVIDHPRMIAETHALLDRLNLPIDPLARIDELSPAERRMVEVARALHLSAEMIVFDEPTNALSSREITDLFGILRTLRAQGVTILYIGHRLEEALQIGDRATVLRDGRKITTVPLAEASLDDLILWIVGRYLPGKYSKPPSIGGPEVLRVERLQRRGELEHVSFSLHAGEIVGIAGLIGAGGTALSRALFGADPAESGSIFVDGEPVTIRTPDDGIANGIGLLPEDRLEQGLILQMQVQHNMTLAALESAWPGPWIDRSREDDIAQYYAGRLGIRSETLAQPARTLSGGTQQKLVLSKWLAARARVLIFDEPTRGVDVGARVEIYRLMEEQARRGTGILLVSSDWNELLGMCDRILVMRRGSVVADLPRARASQREILRLAGEGGLE
jgi:ribose transport system ATP-binding protein